MKRFLFLLLPVSIAAGLWFSIQHAQSETSSQVSGSSPRGVLMRMGQSPGDFIAGSFHDYAVAITTIRSWGWDA